MSVSQHLDPATIFAYATGDLPEAYSVLVAAHIAVCDTCRSAVRAAEELGGALIEDEGAPLADNAFDRLMTEIDGGPATFQRRLHVAETAKGGEVPFPLQRLIGNSLDEISWKRLVPGIKKCDLAVESDDQSSLYMLWISPGMKVPEHSHGGVEMTLVLRGAFEDRFGRFGPGDIADHDEDVEHQPTVCGDEPCICIVASDAQVRYKGLLGRIMQPIVGI